MDKRKGIILAIVLFLIIGLGTFVFANDSDKIADDGQNGDTINNPSSNDDGSDDQTTSDTTEQSESSDEESSGEGGNRNNTINRRPTSANDSDNESDGSGSDDSITVGQTVNYKELLDQLAKMVDEASDKDALALAEEFRKDNNITEGNIDALGDATASETFDEIMAILTDNESPVITPANLNDNYFKEAVKVTITDDTKTAYTITLNGNDVTDSVDLANLTDEGTYVLTVKDAAFNETVVTFAVDRTNPVLLVNGEEVEDGETIYVNKNAILTVDETNLESFTSNGSDRTENVLNGSWTAQKDGTYNIVVTDKAGNETSYTIIVDKTAPVVNNGNLDGAYVNHSVSLYIDEKNDYTLTVTRDGNELVGYQDNMFELSHDGVYVVTVVDVAGNETVVEFTIDKTNPVLYVNDEKVEAGETIYVNEDAKMTVDETNLESFTSNGNDRTESILKGSWTAQNDGLYNIVVTDKAGNTATYTIVVDETPIEKAWLYVLNNTYSKTNLEDKHYTVIGDGQELYVELVFEEMPATTPLIQIGNAEAISMDACYATDWDTEIQYYKCPATIKIDSETQELENGQLIPVKITNIKDAAGNETILTNDHIDSSDKYDEVVFDKEAPEATKIRMYGGKYSQDTGETIWYVNEDSNFTVYVEFAEELFVNPKLDINDITGLEMKLSKCEDGTCYYYYKFSEIEKLNDGFVSIKVYDYSDAAGNVGDDLFLSPDTTNQKIELKGQKLVYIDKTNPTRGYSTLGFEYTDNSDKISLEINGENVYYVKPRDSFLYKIAFSEKIQDGLIATIAGTDISLEYLDYNEDLGYIYGGTYTVPSGLTEGERLDIVVSNIKDLAGNEYAAGTITDVPTSNHRVAVFDNTPAGYNSVDFYVNNGYQEGSEYYATYGSTIVANIRTNELLRENPTFEFTYGDEKIVISGDDVEFTDEEKEEYTYLYRVRYTIPEDFEKIEEEVTLNITNIVDYAGNVTDNGSTTVTNSKRVFIDTLAPQVEELRFNSSNSINNGYANNTHSVGVYITVHEELGEVPTFVIDGNEYSKTEERENAKGYLYAAVTKLPKDTEEGEILFSVTVADKMGNTTTYTNNDIKNDVEGYDGVIYDTTAPELTLVGEDETNYNIFRVESGTEITLKDVLATATDANFKEDVKVKPYNAIFINNVDPSVKYDFSNGFDTKKPTGNRYHVYYKVEDYAGNVTEGEMLIVMSDTTPATITPNQDDNYHVEYGSEYSSVTAKVTDNVDKTITNYEPRVYIRYTYPSAEYNTGELYYNNTFNTTIPGYYLAIWDYTDSSGNISNTLKRWVIVSDTTASVIED